MKWNPWKKTHFHFKEERYRHKDFLKSGMIAKTRSGNLYLVMLNTDMKNTPVSSTGVLRGIGIRGRYRPVRPLQKKCGTEKAAIIDKP